ncbi:MAG: 30S ribosomal protein S9 [Microgenomates group bacterium]
MKNLEYYEAVGRRKKAIARVRLYIKSKSLKKGDFMINNHPLDKVYLESYKKDFILKPLSITDNLNRFAISVIVKGGGITGQMEAIVHGLARALVLVDENYKPILKKFGFLTRDPRKKERRKVGTGGKARREKQSPKR